MKLVPKKKTVGQASYELSSKPPEKILAIDLQREMQKTFEENMNEIIKKHKDWAKKYYIVYLLRRERLMPNVIRQQFVTRKTRPKPNYDMSLFSYDNTSGTLLFHWSIPDEETCIYLVANKEYLPEDQKPLIDFIMKFADGKLE